MNLKLRSVLCVCAIAAVVVTSSCSAVVATLDGIIDASTALVPIVTAASAAGEISAPTAATIMDYLERANTAASNAVTEWESGDSNTVKIAAITADFAGLAAPQLGPGVSSVIQASITSISSLIGELMSQIGASKSGSAGAHAFAHVAGKHKLSALKAKARKNVAAIQAWKAQRQVKAASGN